MHEESLVRALLRQVKEVADRHAAIRIREIEVEVGPLSGVEPLLLRTAFERVLAETHCPEIVLTIRETALSAICRQCHVAFDMTGFQFLCPACGSTAIQVTRGDELRLLNVVLETSDQREG